MALHSTQLNSRDGTIQKMWKFEINSALVFYSKESILFHDSMTNNGEKGTKSLFLDIKNQPSPSHHQSTPTPTQKSPTKRGFFRSVFTQPLRNVDGQDGRDVNCGPEMSARSKMDGAAERNKHGNCRRHTQRERAGKCVLVFGT